MLISASTIARYYPVWRYLWPFQSAIQLWTYAILLPIGLSFMFLLVYFLDPAAPLIAILLSSALGGLSVLYTVLPGAMTIRASSGAGEVGRSIRDYILASNYMITAMGNGVIRYTPVGSPWLRWKENSLTVSPCDDSTLRLEGPILGLLQLRKLLEDAQADSTTLAPPSH